MASITWEKDGQAEALKFVENSTNGYFVDANDTVIAPVGLSNYTPTLMANLVTAAQAHSGHLHFPAGSYSLLTPPSDGVGVLRATAADVTITGAGIGRTLLQCSSWVLTGATIDDGSYYLFHSTGANFLLADLSIQFDSISGNGQTWGVVLNGMFPTVRNIEISGVYGTTNAGGFGIDLSRSWNNAEFTTTLGTTVTAGSRTCTPPSMEGIYLGNILSIAPTTTDVISSADELVTVTATTATTFTATFVHAHGPSTVVAVWGRGAQHALVENCTVRDSYSGAGYGVNSNHNRFNNCRALRLGYQTTTPGTSGVHGWYIHGGYNVFHECLGEGVGGITFNNYANISNLDTSHNTYEGCTSINPMTGHMVVTTTNSTGLNPDIPNLIEDNRSVKLVGCTFRTTPGASVSTGVSIGVPATVMNCIFEDTLPIGNSKVWLSLSDDHCTVTGNIFRSVNSTATGWMLKSTGIECNASGNSFYDSTSEMQALALGNYSLVRGNTVDTLLGNGIGAGSYSVIADNVIVINSTAAHCLELGAAVELDIHDNVLSHTHAGGYYVVEWNNAATGRFHHNNIVSGQFEYDAPTAGLILESNRGLFTQGGSQALTLTGEEGRLILFTTSGGVQPTSGYGVILNAGLAERAGTGSTVLAGISTSDTSSGKGVFLVSQPGAVVSAIMDAAWTIGNVALPSTGTAGKWMDSTGTTQPTYRKSYGILLNSGGGAGTARMLIAQMG